MKNVIIVVNEKAVHLTEQETDLLFATIHNSLLDGASQLGFSKLVGSNFIDKINSLNLSPTKLIKE